MQNALTKLSWSFVSLLLVALLTFGTFDNVKAPSPPPENSQQSEAPGKHYSGSAAYRNTNRSEDVAC